MKPEEDPWLIDAHKNAELLDREIKKLSVLTCPIKKNRPLVTKYQDFWNQEKHVTALFKKLKPLAQSDRDLLWNQFNTQCEEVKAKQKSEYGTIESHSQAHFEEIVKLVEQAQLHPGAPAPKIHELVKRGQALKTAGDLLGKFKHEMIAKHKKTSFDRIQKIRETHDAAWEAVKAGKSPVEQSETDTRLRKNLEANYERNRKAVIALENYQIGRGHIRKFLTTCEIPEKIASARAQLEETERRIKDIEDGIRKLEKWIEIDEQLLMRE
ncbi:MAG: hypothetical protein WCF90_02700 [Methanomicrobiales archaeon]